MMTVSCNAQEKRITVPRVKNGICIQFFYSPNGEFDRNTLFSPPVFLSQVVYDKWDEFTADFPASSRDSALVQFNWRKLGSLNEHNWKTIVNNVGDMTYIGNFLDMKENHESKKIKIVNIIAVVFNPACSPETEILYVECYLGKR